jgi:acetoin utilization deacetylase AcuC-like enzyme
MTTLLFSHPACLDHDTGYGHPESAARLSALLERLDAPEFAMLQRRSAPPAQQTQLTRAHDASYVLRVLSAIPKSGEASIAPDVAVTPGSGEAALRAAGSVCAAVDAIKAGEAHNAFCAVRPPGHHAGPNSTMGFCIFNNVAVGVQHARQVHGFKRVAVIDFDVHHGNGTQAIFRNDPEVCFASIHQSMIFPRSGDSTEVGVGNLRNVPLIRGTSAAAFRDAFAREVMPHLRAFDPDFLFISAGFDAHVRDPLGDLKLMTTDFTWLTEQLKDLAEACCGGRLVSVLEGGYNPGAVADAGAAHLRVLMTEPLRSRRSSAGAGAEAAQPLSIP